MEGQKISEEIFQNTEEKYKYIKKNRECMKKLEIELIGLTYT